jgi:DNA primase large subunit
MLKQRKNGSKLATFVGGELKEYSTTLNFYKIPPTFSVTLNEFESCALDRLAVLVAIDSARLRINNDVEIMKLVDPIIQKKLDLKQNSQLKQIGSKLLYEQRRKDHLSHFILRLAYCKTPELQKWFCNLEARLFEMRYKQANKADRDIFLLENDIKFESVSREVMSNVTGIDHSAIREFYKDVDSFYKVPFGMVPELVAKRMVILHKGYAYVSVTDITILIVQTFTKHLMNELAKTAKALPRMDEDDRIMPILYNLAKQSISNEYVINTNKDEITAQDIKGLVGHYPPCMQALHNSLTRDLHLRHVGRIQYGLFLKGKNRINKGIGLPLEEALIFWRMSFSKLSDEEFNKKGYPYNIRYNYGMEGKRTNYTPYSCMKMIHSLPGPGETHGCPFRQYSTELLTDMMLKMNVSISGCNEVIQRAQGGHYQMACTRLFELTRGLVHSEAQKDFILLEPINHPNKWFDMSKNGFEDKIKSE